jgi:L-ascorbate metabolism protein UlaG (beta-lactamase superfamily)
MILRKFEHACFSVEQDGSSLIVDPGNWTTDLSINTNVKAVIITHEHQDHMSIELLRKIISKNPGAIVVVHESIAHTLHEFSIKPIVPNEIMNIGGFELAFFGGQHAEIQKGMPGIANVGVLINKTLYYPGDSFVAPNVPVQVLALPIAAPWLKFSEIADFVESVKPAMAFPTHDGILSENGRRLLDTMVSSIATKNGTVYRRLDSQRIDI